MIKPAFQKLLMQLNILGKEYFGRDLLQQIAPVQQSAVRGKVLVEEIEDLMKLWQSLVMLDAQKEAEMLFTDEQLSARSILKKQITDVEARIEELRMELAEQDRLRQDLEKELLNEPDENVGSQLLAAACDEFWEQLVKERKSNVDARYQALVDFISRLKKQVSDKQVQAEAQGGGKMATAAIVSGRAAQFNA